MSDRNAMEKQIILTRDGSHTIEIPDLKVTYHSHHGAIQESMHVFIQEGLRHITAITEEGLNIFEMGFGTGLNAFLTALEARQIERKINYTAIETSPLDTTVIEQLNYGTTPSERDFFLSIHNVPWEQSCSIAPFFTIKKLNRSLLEWQPDTDFNLVYFDAFAPGAQPELWTREVFEKIYACLKSGGVLVTYCSKGEVRRAMQAAGLQVEKLPGPPGKREMVRARKE